MTASHVRLWVKRLAVAALAISVIAGLLVVAAHLPWTKAAVARFAATQIAEQLGGTATLEGLDYQLWKGELRVTGASWTSEDGAISAGIASLDVHFGLSGLSSIEIHAPEIRLDQSIASENEDPVAIPIWLLTPRLRVTDATLVIENPAEGYRARLEAMNIDLDRGAGALTINSGSFERSDASIALRQVTTQFRLTISGVEADELRIELGESSVVTGSLQVTSFSPLRLDTSLTHALDLVDFRAFAPDLDATGTLTGSARLGLDDDQWSGEGTISSDALSALSTRVNGSVPYRFDQDRLDIEGGTLVGFGGRVQLDGSWDFSSNQQEVRASLEGIQIPAGISSQVSGTVGASLQAWDVETASGRAELQLRAEPTREGIPVSGPVRVDLDSGRLQVEAVGLRTMGAELDVVGEVGDALALDYEARVSDLSAVEAVPASLELSGRGVATGRITGTRDNPVVTADVSTEALMIREVPVDAIGSFSWDGGRVTVTTLTLSQTSSDATLSASGSFDPQTRQLSLDGDGGGFVLDGLAPDVTAQVPSIRFGLEGPIDALTGQATTELTGLSYRGIPLADTSFRIDAEGSRLRLVGSTSTQTELLAASVTMTAPYPAEIRLRLDELPLQELVHTFPELSDASIELDGELIAEGNLSAILDSTYRLEASQLAGSFQGIGLGAGAFVVEGDRYAMSVLGLTLVGDDTAIDVEGEVPLTTSGVFDVAVKGSSRLEILDGLQPGANLAGRVDAEMEVRGTLPIPSVRGTLNLSEVSLEAASVRVDDARASLLFENTSTTIQELTGTLLGGTFTVDGVVPHNAEGETGRLNFRVDDLDPTTLLASNVEGVEAVAISASGALAGAGLDPALWSGSGEIDRFRIQSGSTTIAQRQSASWTFTDGTLSVPGLQLSGGFTELELQASVSPWATPLAWSARASGPLDPAGLSPMLAAYGLSFTGTTRLDVSASSGEEPLVVRGTASIREGRLSVREPAISFTSLTADIEVTEEALTLSGLTADAGGGSVRASGRATLASGQPAELDFEAVANAVRLSYPEGLRSQLDGTLRWHGPFDAPRITGTVTLDRAIYSADINLETELLQSLSRVQATTAEESLSSKTRLDIRVRTREGLRIDNNLARVEASANLRVTGTLAEPDLVGTVTARPGGQFRLGRNRYRLESGRITLEGYPSEPAALDVTAKTAVSEYDIDMRVHGTTETLVTDFTGIRRSDQSDISRADAASLLVTGRTLDRVSIEGRTILGEQMASYVGSSLGDLAQLGLGEVLPFRLITVEPDLVAGEADPSARFTLGAGLTDTLSLVYSVGLDDAEKQIWIVDYQMPYRSRSQIIRQIDNEFTAAVSQQLQFGRSDAAARGTDQTARIGRLGFYFVSGEPLSFQDEAQGQLDLGPGDRYDYWTAWGRAEQLRDWLRDEGFLDATVDLKQTPCGAGCVDLDAFVATGKRIRFLWTGDEMPGAVEKEMRTSWDGYLTSAFLASELAAVAERELYRKKHYDSVVQVEIEERVEETVVTVDAQLGPKGNRVEVIFEGRQAVSQAQLLSSLPVVSSGAFYDLTRTKRGRLVQLLKLSYAALGYLEAEVGEPERHFDPESGVLHIRIPVTERQLFTVAGIDLEGVSQIDPAVVQAQLKLSPGAPFRITDFVSDRAAVASLYRRRGFRDVEVEASVVGDGEGGAYRAEFVVREGQEAIVGEVRVAGNRRTRERVVRREVALSSGEPLTTENVNETQRRLYELGIFRSADVVIEEPADDSQATQDIVIDVTEVPVATLDYGFRYTTDGLAEVVAEVRTPNLFGSGQRTGFRTLVGSEQRIFRFLYHTPYIFPLKINTNFFVERAINRETPKADEDFFPFTDRIWTFTAQQGRPLLPGLDLQWSYSFKRTETELDPDEFDPEGQLFSVDRGILTGSLIGDFRNGVVNPKSGTFWSLSFQGAPKVLGSELTFVKMYAQVYTFVPLGRGIVWAGGYRVGVANSFGQRLVEDDRFQAGGPNSVRGFAQGSLGPFDPILQRTLGGAATLVFNQEVRFPIAWRLEGVGFFDAGNAFETPSDMRLSDLRQNWGAGIRLALPFGLLRFDWARVISLREGEDPWQFIFSLGHAF